MAGLYIRKFRPNKLHLVSAALLLTALIFFISGAYRAFRMTGCTDQSELSHEIDIRKSRSITLCSKPVEEVFEGTEDTQTIVFAQISKGIISDYELMIVNAAGKYRYIAAEKDSEEYHRLMKGEEVTGYISDKYSSDFMDFISGMHKYHSKDNVINEKECSELGIIVVDKQNEMLSFTWGIPFLAAGLLMLLKAGNPFFYIPEDIIN